MKLEIIKCDETCPNCKCWYQSWHEGKRCVNCGEILPKPAPAAQEDET